MQIARDPENKELEGSLKRRHLPSWGLECFFIFNYLSYMSQRCLSCSNTLFQDMTLDLIVFWSLQGGDYYVTAYKCRQYLVRNSFDHGWAFICYHVITIIITTQHMALESGCSDPESGSGCSPTAPQDRTELPWAACVRRDAQGARRLNFLCWTGTGTAASSGQPPHRLHTQQPRLLTQPEYWGCSLAQHCRGDELP